MIRTLTAYTEEIDEVQEAVDEILEQLQLEDNLCKYSVGILSCYLEYIESGVIEALGEALPFDIVGCTTMANAVNAEMGTLMLCLTVLTSDDIRFSAAVTAPLDQDQYTPLQQAYDQAVSGLDGRPDMLLAYLPLINHVGGEILVKGLDAISGGLPIFGTVAIDHLHDWHECRVIHNGKAYRDCAAVVTLQGDLNPTFIVANISDGMVQKQKAIITESEGNVLKKVNDMPILEYLKTLNIDKDSGLNSTVTIPFVIDYNDGSKPIARSIYLISPEGYAICGGDMPVNSTLSIGCLDDTDVLRTTGKSVEELMQTGKTNGLLAYTCLTRLLVLGIDVTAEMERMRDIVGQRVPFQLCYSGGEICPLPDETGKLVNRFHNSTFSACIF